MAKGLLSVLVLFSAIGISFASQIQEFCRFLPENDVYIPVDQVSTFGGGITEQQFNKVIDRIEAIYSDDVKALGGELVVNRLWDNGTVNANATREGTKFVVNMYGGLARHETVTEDGFATVLCHELGHHVGGAPKIKRWTMTWASNEGEADYYATLKCLRRYFAKDDNEKLVASLDIPQIVQSQCSTDFSDRTDQLMCMRGAMAGLSVSTLLATLGGGGDIDFNTPDTKQVRKTVNAHPRAQCRLDTYLAGAVCDAPVTAALSDTDFKQGACWDPAVSKAGLRPRCWFQPEPTWWEKWKDRWKKKKGGGTVTTPEDQINDQYEDSIKDGVIH